MRWHLSRRPPQRVLNCLTPEVTLHIIKQLLQVWFTSETSCTLCIETQRRTHHRREWNRHNMRCIPPPLSQIYQALGWRTATAQGRPPKQRVAAASMRLTCGHVMVTAAHAGNVADTLGGGGIRSEARKKFVYIKSASNFRPLQ